MNTEILPFRPLELGFIAAYLMSLIFVGWLGYRARRESSLRDFYLAGRGIGFVVLLLTLYATQYSGNTLFGFTGKTYRIGFGWAVSVHFMTAIVVAYLLIAPQLFRLSRLHGFITPADFLSHRFGSPLLSSIATVVMVVAIANYLLAQLMAMGRALEGLTTLNPGAAYSMGVILLALIIVVYETLGGLRAVVWTDVIQGFVLIVGFGILLGLVFHHYGSLRTATEVLLRAETEHVGVMDGGAGLTLRDVRHEGGPSRVFPPGPKRTLEWISYILAVGIGGALYPQAIQRIYAARSATTLRRTLAVMAFLPLTTTVIALIVGIMGAAYGPLLKDAESDKILTVICSQIQQQSLFGRWLVTVLFAAVLAAIMSTADSVLLSISSMLTKDIYGQWFQTAASEARLTAVGKVASWILLTALTCLAVLLRHNTSLVYLLDRKFDLLLQLAPAFFIGLHWSGLRAGPTLLGLIVGVAIAMALAFGVDGKVAGIHPGIYGLAANATIAVVGSIMQAQRSVGRDGESSVQGAGL